MKYRICSKTETEIYGATHMNIITFADLAASPAALTMTFNCLPATTAGVLPALGVSGTDQLTVGFKTELVAVILDTVFSGGAIATCTLSVGDTVSGVRHLAATNVFTGQTLFHFTGIIANQPFVNTAVQNATALFTTTTGNVNVATAGQVRLYWKCVDLTQLPTS